MGLEVERESEVTVQYLKGVKSALFDATNSSNTQKL